MSIIDAQLVELRGKYPGASVSHLPDGSSLVTVADVPLGAGWNQDRAALSFIVPISFPVARPDCFYADPNLRLASGAMPTNAALQPVPHTGLTLLWFSWHLATWNPTHDSLLTYLRVIRERLGRAN